MKGFSPSEAARPSNQRAGSHHYLWFLLAAGVLVLQQFAVRGLGADGSEALLRRGIFFVTSIGLVAMALHFRRFAGAWFVAAGILLNLPPIMAHGGLMPVAYDTVEASGLLPGLDQSRIGQQITGSKDIILQQDDIHFTPLADQYIVAIPGYGPNIYSIGDFVLFAGVAVAMGEALAMITFPAPGRRQSPLPA